LGKDQLEFDVLLFVCAQSDKDTFTDVFAESDPQFTKSELLVHRMTKVAPERTELLES